MNNEQVQEIFIEDIIPNRFQPRLTFDETALQELSDSIKMHGIIQPLVLRRVGNKYEIIAGERRYKASCMAGLKKVPAIVREMNDNESAEVALIENVQRKNLSSIEEAQSYKNLLDRGYLTQEELAGKIGVNQSTIANKMRLLNLCDEVQNALLNEQISERHARSLLVFTNPDDQKNMLNRIIKERLTVKQLDMEIKKITGENSLSDFNIDNDAPIETFEVNKEISPKVNKSIFGFTIDAPTDLEETAPNLNTGVHDTIAPVEFNPFASEPMIQSNAPIESPKDNIETFDIFGSQKTEDISEPINPFELKQESPNEVKSLGEEINDVRQCIKKIENDGYRVELEEYNFEDIYQIVVKIKKESMSE